MKEPRQRIERSWHDHKGGLTLYLTRHDEGAGPETRDGTTPREWPCLHGAMPRLAADFTLTPVPVERLRVAAFARSSNSALRHAWFAVRPAFVTSFCSLMSIHRRRHARIP